MIKRKKILLGNKDIISRKIKDFQIDVQLNKTGRELVPNSYENTFDLLKQYKRERNNCRNFRIYGTIDSPFIECDNLTMCIFKNEPQISGTTPELSAYYINTVISKPLISENWECKNLFNKKKGKFLIELDSYIDSDYVYIYFADISPEYQNLFKIQLVYRYNTINIMGENVVQVVPYGSDEAILDIDGNVLLIDNDFDFFYNKHWVKQSIAINKIRQKKWIPDESTAICVQEIVYTGGTLSDVYPETEQQFIPGELFPVVEQLQMLTSTTIMSQ